MSKIITFEPLTEFAELILEYPKPTSKAMPEWYKKMNMYIEEGNKTPKPRIFDLKSTNLTVKSCIPFLDAMSMGYVVTLPADVLACDIKEHNYRLLWDVQDDALGTPLIGQHSENQLSKMPLPDGFEKDAFKFNSSWIIRTPPGYSCIFTHPFNNFEQPFYTLTGIVDTDTYETSINFPFLLKENFVGTIYKGTPIVQIIPFKREDWKSENLKYNSKSIHFMSKLKTTIFRSYMKNFWSKKNYD